jgi:hypothetical protein
LSKEEFAVFTSQEGLYAGRVYVFKCHDRSTRERWIEMLHRVITSYSGAEIRKSTRLGRVRHRVRWLYMSDVLQLSVAGLIMANFLANILEASVTPTKTSTHLFDIVDLLFTAVFTLELLVNMFATVIARTFANMNTRSSTGMHAQAHPLTHTHVHSRTHTHDTKHNALAPMHATHAHAPDGERICGGPMEPL